MIFINSKIKLIIDLIILNQPASNSLRSEADEFLEWVVAADGGGMGGGGRSGRDNLNHKDISISNDT